MPGNAILARRGRVLCCAEDPTLLRALRRAGHALSVDVVEFAPSTTQWQTALRRRWDAAVLEIHASQDVDDWTQRLHQLRQHDARLPILVVVHQPSTALVMTAARCGAFSCLSRSDCEQQLQAELQRACEARSLLLQPFQSADHQDMVDPPELLGTSRAMQQFSFALGASLTSDRPLLLHGEPGTGKHHAARYWAQQLPSPGHCIVRSCRDDVAQIQQDFRRADASAANEQERREARATHSGDVLLLEESEWLPRKWQAELMQRAKETRIVLLTREDPRLLWQAGLWRSDFFQWTAAHAIRVPPLRERGAGDILLLAHKFVCRQFAMAHDFDFPTGIPRMTKAAQQLLTEYNWPGNVAQLRAVIAAATSQQMRMIDEWLLQQCLAAAQATDDAHSDADAPPVSTTPLPADWESPQLWQQFVDTMSAANQPLYAAAAASIDRGLISEVLRRTGGNRARAARMLGMTRTSLRRKMASEGISVESGVTNGAPMMAEPTTAPQPASAATKGTSTSTGSTIAATDV